MPKLNTKQTKWNLKPLFRGDSDPKMEERRKLIQQKSYEFIDKWKDRSDYLEDPAILKQALDEYEQWQRFYAGGADEYYYFSLRTAIDQNDHRLKAKNNKIQDFANKISNDIQFFALKIAKIPPEQQEKFLNYPDLRNYKHFLEKLFTQAKYLLSDPEERIINLKAATSFYNWVSMTESFLAKEERTIILKNGKKGIANFSTIMSFLDHKNKKIRDTAAEAFNDILKKHSEVAEMEINSILTNHRTDDELRKIPRPDLQRHIADDVDSSTVDTLVNTITSRYDISKRYYKLKAKLMGVKKLKYHEKSVEYGDFDKKYSYSDAINLTYDVLNKLDPKFSQIFVNYLNNGQLDVFPKKGKSMGGFCTDYLITHPTYILLNYTGRLFDVLTIPHEMGHGIHNELMREKQNALNFGTSLFTTEMASTFMEDFALEQILKEADDKSRLALLMFRLNEYVTAVLAQAAHYNFELELHRDLKEKGYLSKEEIGKLFHKHMFSYLGNYVERSPGSENWWIYRHHLRASFYNYQYASGILTAKSLERSVKENPEFMEKVKQFLGAGISYSPKNILANLGIDIENAEFWEKGLEEIDNLLGETENLAKKLKKL